MSDADDDEMIKDKVLYIHEHHHEFTAASADVA